MNHPKIKPLSNKVLIKREEAAETHKGILLPDSAKKKPKQGEVVAIGPGRREDDGTLSTMRVKVGDRVLFSSYAGVELQSDERYLIMNEDEILANVE